MIRKKVPDYKLSDPEKDLEKTGPFNTVDAPPLPSLGFWYTPFGRTLRGKNKTGKIVYGVLGAGATYFLGFNPIPLINPVETGVPIMEFADLNLWQFIITLVFMVISFVVGLYKMGPNLKEKINILVELLSVELVKATDDASEGGKKITRDEITAIVKKVVATVFTSFTN
nr:hypothetical protein 28 [bacterium]